MKKIRIVGDAEHDLPRVTVGRVSALELMLQGVPQHLDNVQVHFTKPGNETANPCPAALVPGGEWKVYATGAYFTDVGKARYHVTGRTPQGDSVYLGGGPLVVVQSVLNTTDEAELVIPPDMFARGANGLFYKVTADVDGDGVPFLIVDPNGVTK